MYDSLLVSGDSPQKSPGSVEPGDLIQILFVSIRRADTSDQSSGPNGAIGLTQPRTNRLSGLPTQAFSRARVRVVMSQTSVGP